MKKNTAKEYVCVRVRLVRVKKRFLGRIDKVLANTTYIPETDVESIRVYNELSKMIEKKGVVLRK